MNVLFYTPFNSRSRDTESVMQAFVSDGHTVFLLTQTQQGSYHEECRKLGVQVYSKLLTKSNPIVYFLRHSIYLFRFIKEHKIDIVYAHLETAALPAVLIQPFVKAKVVACRHIVDEAYLFKNKNFILLNKIVYRLARHVITVSVRSKDFMINTEKINSSKIQVIRLAYNFELYPGVDYLQAAKIRSTYPSELLLLTACRLVGPKRANNSIQVVQELLKMGIEAKLLILGDGPDRGVLQALVTSAGLENNVWLLGFKTNILDYLAACDWLVHPSLLDSSSVIIKEAGLCQKPIVVCSGVGDVDEYLTHGQNAFLVSRENTVLEMVSIIGSYYRNKSALEEMGRALKESVRERFSINHVIEEYRRFHKTMKTN